MNKTKEVVEDILKAFIIVAGITSVIVILCMLIGVLINQGDLVKGLIIAERIVLLIGGLGLLVIAGMLLKTDGLRPLIHKRQWKNYFKRLYFSHVFFLFCVGFLFFGGLLDYLVRLLEI